MLTVWDRFFFLFGVHFQSLVVKTDPYHIVLKFSDIFPIVRVSEGRHARIVLVMDSISAVHIFLGSHTVNACIIYM